MATAFSQGDNGNLLSAITGATQSEAPSFAGFNPTLEDIQQERKKREIIKAVMPMLDFQNKMREVHPEITEEAIKGIPQGLNSGYKDISEYQQLAGVPIPQGQEQIDLARAGQFNLPEQDQNAAMVKTLMDKIKGGMTDIGNGFDDNTRNGFAFDNLQADPNKTGWNRVGEALGTGYRLLGNPALQGLFAGAIYGKARGNGWEGLKYGVDWAQNKMKSDYYADKLGVKRGILGGFGKEDYNSDVLSQYRTTMADNAKLKTEAQLDKSNPKMKDYADTMLASGLWDEDEYNAFVSSDNFVPDNRLNMNVVKEMTNKAYKEKGIQIKDKELAAKIDHWSNQDANNARRTSIYGQSVANSKANADRNYKLKEDKWNYQKEHPELYSKGGKGKSSSQTKSQTVRVKSPDGKTGSIPIDDLQTALNEGYTVIK